VVGASTCRSLRLRLSAGLAFLALFVLVDEIVKEGYAFDPVDLINPQITHEKLFVVFLFLAILLGWRRR
jgi:hypothetical protein